MKNVVMMIIIAIIIHTYEVHVIHERTISTNSLIVYILLTKLITDIRNYLYIIIFVLGCK